MTDREIELLPLPEGYDKYSPPRLYDGQMFHEGQMRAYARANSARAIAPLQAEIEALRRQIERDEGLLRQALKALEYGAWDTLSGRNAAAAIRERLGEDKE